MSLLKNKLLHNLSYNFIRYRKVIYELVVYLLLFAILSTALVGLLSVTKDHAHAVSDLQICKANSAQMEKLLNGEMEEAEYIGEYVKVTKWKPETRLVKLEEWQKKIAKEVK